MVDIKPGFIQSSSAVTFDMETELGAKINALRKLGFSISNPIHDYFELELPRYVPQSMVSEWVFFIMAELGKTVVEHHFANTGADIIITLRMNDLQVAHKMYNEQLEHRRWSELYKVLGLELKGEPDLFTVVSKIRELQQRAEGKPQLTATKVLIEVYKAIGWRWDDGNLDLGAATFEIETLSKAVKRPVIDEAPRLSTEILNTLVNVLAIDSRIAYKDLLKTIRQHKEMVNRVYEIFEDYSHKVSWKYVTERIQTMATNYQKQVGGPLLGDPADRPSAKDDP